MKKGVAPTPAYWYYGLILISLVLIITSLAYKRNWKLLVLYFNIIAAIHPFEITVLILFHGYCYLPGIVDDPKLDNYLGSYVSNSLIVPASAMAINAFSLCWKYSMAIAALFTGIDWYFTKLGIYRHFWWKSIYTGIGLSILYLISKWFWRHLQDKRPTLLFRLLAIYATYAPIHNLIAFILNQGGQLFRFQVNWFADPEKSHQIFFFLHLLVTSVVITLCIGLRMQFRYRLLGILALPLINWLFEQCHIFSFSIPDFTALHYSLISILAVAIVIFLFKLARLDYLFP